VQKQLNLPYLLNREVSPRSLLSLLTILVLLLHLTVIVWLLQPNETVPEQKPIKVMEVALLSAPSPKPATTVAAVVPPTPPKPLPPPKKQPIKQPVKKIVPVVEKQATQPKPQPIVEDQPPTPPAESTQVSTQPVPTAQPTNNQASNPSENTSTAEANAKTVVSGIVPLERVPPRYPPRAANRHIEGWVKIEFTISTTGTVTDAVVVDAEPADMFNDAALTAIEKWKFKEKLINGVAVTQRAVQILKFNLKNE